MKTNGIVLKNFKTKEEKTEALKEYILEKYPNVDVSLVNYNSYTTKIDIICDKHGLFSITPMKLIYRGQFCKSCGMKKAGEKRIKNLGNSKKFKELYDGIYSTSEDLDSIKAKDKIELCCKKHGYFDKDLYSLLRGKHCPSCSREDACSNNGCGEKHFMKNYVEGKSCFYIAEFVGNGESFLKFGISNDITKRFKGMYSYKNTNIKALYVGEHAYTLENLIKNAMNKYYPDIKYTPKLKFGGYTECYKTKELLEFLRECEEQFIIKDSNGELDW